jgi:hypothetical protein
LYGLEGGASTVGHDADMFLPVQAEIKVNTEITDCVDCLNLVLKVPGRVSKPNAVGPEELVSWVLEENNLSFVWLYAESSLQQLVPALPIG